MGKERDLTWRTLQGAMAGQPPQLFDFATHGHENGVLTNRLSNICLGHSKQGRDVLQPEIIKPMVEHAESMSTSIQDHLKPVLIDEACFNF
jgi:hypothetical protein